MCRIYALRISHSLESYFVRHLQMELLRSDWVTDSNDLISREEALRATEAAMSVFFARVLAVAAYEVIDYELVSVSVLGLVL